MIGTNAPYADEWEFVPALVGAEPALPWLWQQHNEHRMVLPRAVYLLLFKLTHDFRAGMLVQVAMLSCARAITSCDWRTGFAESRTGPTRSSRFPCCMSGTGKTS